MCYSDQPTDEKIFIIESENTTVCAPLGEIGRHGRCSVLHLHICHEFSLIGMDLSAVGSSDITNVFTSNLNCFVREQSNPPVCHLAAGVRVYVWMCVL